MRPSAWRSSGITATVSWIDNDTTVRELSVDTGTAAGSVTVKAFCWKTGHSSDIASAAFTARAVEISGFDDTSRSGAGSMSESFFVSPADASCSAWRSSGITATVSWIDNDTTVRELSVDTGTAAGSVTVKAFCWKTGHSSDIASAAFTATCPTGHVLLSDTCVEPLRALDDRFYTSIVPPPSGHGLALSCFRTVLSDESNLYTCRRSEPSRVFISKASALITAVSEPYAPHGIMLTLSSDVSVIGGVILEGDAALEGCQSVSSDYWQCNHVSDLIWFQRTVSATLTNYILPALTQGVLRPLNCGLALVRLWVSRDPAGINLVVNACGLLG